jgi:putative effector of murein hydrolase
VTSVTAVIELLVGAACIAIAFPCWRQGATVFRVMGVVLAVAGITAVVNAVVTLVR